MKKLNEYTSKEIAIACRGLTFRLKGTTLRWEITGYYSKKIFYIIDSNSEQKNFKSIDTAWSSNKDDNIGIEKEDALFLQIHLNNVFSPPRKHQTRINLLDID